MSGYTLENIKHLKGIFLAGVNGVQPHTIFQQNQCFSLNKNKIIVKTNGDDCRSDEFDVSDKKIHVVGFGKAVLGLTIEIENVLKERLVSGIISVPSNSVSTMLQKYSNATLLQNGTLKTRVYEGAKDNLPDKNAFEASQNIVKMCEKMTEEDVLICLISGGGSSLLPYPTPPLTLIEKIDLIKALSKKGATINELNSVRIAMSQTKGGRLANSAKNSHQIISLIISDIVNDPLELIASGPTVPQTELNCSVEILKKYNIEPSEKVLNVLKSNSPVRHLRNVNNYIIANNKMSIISAMNEAKKLGYETLYLSNSIQGDITDVFDSFKTISEVFQDRSYHKLLRKFNDNNFVEKLKQTMDAMDSDPGKVRGICIVSGGEPTVQVTGKGLGGRNQQLALQFSEYCTQNAMTNVLLLSAGTDGIDGPTDAAGAIGGYFFNNDILALIKNHLKDNNSYNFFKKYAPNFHIFTGHTGTNVMDLQILLYTPFSTKSSL